MKKSLLALAVLGAFAGVASAQSSVTLYGTIDLNARYVKNDGSNRRVSLSQDGINSSQLGFRGVEDLGGGLKASFVLLAGVNADTGTTNSKFFNRRATVSLSGGFGEIRLGRDYTPTFWNNTVFDAFGTNGIGDSSTIKQLVAADYVRADNSIGYFLPAMGGLYGQVMAAAGEGTTAGRYLGGRLGFAAGPFDVAVAYAQERLLSVGTSLGPVAVPNGEKYKTWNVGGSYDFGVVKLLGYYNHEKIADASDKIFSISAVIPLGQGEVHVGGERGKASIDGFSNKSTKYALGYVYNLSKRTAVYGTAARVTNGNNAFANSVVGSYAGTGGVSPSSQQAFPRIGGHSTGVEFGVRHFF